MSRRGWWLVGGVIAFWLLALAGIGAVALTLLGDLGGGGRAFDEIAVEGDGEQKVAIIRVSGEIHAGESEPGFVSSGGAGATDIIAQIRQASEDDDVAAVILRLETPGGAVVASDEIYRALGRLDVPVVSSMGDVAASGGYYLAAGSDRIVANPATMTGSIGVIMVVPDLSGTAEEIGLDAAVLKSGEFKDAGFPLSDLSPEERELFQRLIDEAYDQFVDAIVTGRDMEEAEVRRLADGRVYSGLQAEENGLIDEFGDLDRAYDVALELAQLDRDAARLVEYSKPTGFGGLLGPLGRSPIDEAKQELGIGFGLKYLFVP